ncbi:hypothetical protein [Lysobacter gummosus]|nr:hypothetical protein LG3211_3814 [Lysobacter gummosus]
MRIHEWRSRFGVVGRCSGIGARTRGDGKTIAGCDRRRTSCA